MDGRGSVLCCVEADLSGVAQLEERNQQVDSITEEVRTRACIGVCLEWIYW